VSLDEKQPHARAALSRSLENRRSLILRSHDHDQRSRRPRAALALIRLRKSRREQRYGVKQIGRIIRCICVLSHLIPNTNDTESNQIIIPYQQIPGRKSDIYILAVSYAHKVCVANKWSVGDTTNSRATGSRPNARGSNGIDASSQPPSAHPSAPACAETN
jgi:hypothetical protein